MTRPSSLAAELPTLNARLGSVFPAPSSLSSNTVDRAAGLDVFTPPSESSISLVRSATDGSSLGGLDTVALGGTASVGNLLTFVVGGRDTTGVVPTAPAGWTAHPDGAAFPDGDDGVAVFYKIAAGTETDVTFPGWGGGWSGGIAEWSGVSALDTSAETTGDSTAMVGASVNPTAGAEALIIGGFAITTGDFATSATPGAGWTELHDAMVPGPAHPLMWAAYQIVASASGSYAPTGTPTNTAGKYGGQTLVFSRSNNPANVGGNATDDDPATYVSTASTVDIDLGDRYEIVRSTVRLATASGGSRTFTIYGANVADFSDAVALDSTTFTADGSFGAQDISFSWARGQSFRYYRLENTVETWRLHTWELYEPTVGDTHDHDFIPESTFDAKGDLLVGTGSDAYARKGSVSSNVYSLQTRQDGDLEWQPFVRSLVSNGSNTLQRPDVNLVSGTGIIFAITSNSLTISSTASGGGSPGASGVTIEDDGAQEGTGVTTLDFAGDGVSVAVSGTEATVTIAGAAGGSVSTVEPDPIPDADDDEMAVTDTSDPISGWTTLGTLAALNRSSQATGHLYLNVAANSATRVDGVYKSVALADGEAFVASIPAMSMRANFNRAGIFIGEASPGRIDTCAIVFSAGPQFEVLAMTTPTSLSGTVVATSITQHVPIYLAIRRNSSTSYDYLWSRDGQLWFNGLAARNPSITQATVGLFVNPQNASVAAAAFFDWARIYTTLPGVVI